MSLTQHIADKGSPIREYLGSRFPIIDQTKQGHPLSKAAQRLLGLPELRRKAVLESPVPSGQRGVVGTALDYRMRYYFNAFEAKDTVAALGAACLDADALFGPFPQSSGSRARLLARQFFKLHDGTVKKIRPVKSRIPHREEELLARHCIILAHYEHIYRAGTAINSPLFQLATDATIEDLLAIPTQDCIQDVCQLSYAFEEDARDLFHLDAVCNPTFAGSRAIGGADADFIVGSTLFDVKTTSKPDNALLRTAMLQLLGYALLDYGDEFGIREIGVYLPRQRSRWCRPLWMFLLKLEEAEVLLTLGSPPDDLTVRQQLEAARAEFKEIVRAASRPTAD